MTPAFPGCAGPLPSLVATRRTKIIGLLFLTTLGAGRPRASDDDHALPPLNPVAASVTGGSPTEDLGVSSADTKASGGQQTFEPHQNLVENTVAADTWELVSGDEEQNAAPRFIYPQPNLRHATSRYEPTFTIPAAEVALFKLLAAPLPEGGLQLVEESTLRDLQAWMAKTYRLPLRIDHQALEDCGIDADTILETRHVEGVTLGAALATVLAAFDLETTVRHESLMLTTREVAESRLLLGVYPLPTQLTARRTEQVIGTIHETVAAETWDVVGGIGAIRAVPEANALVISQTFPVHQEIVALLRATFDADLDADDDGQPAERPIRVHRVRDPAIAKEVAANLAALCNAALAGDADPTAVVTLLGEDRIVIQSASRPFQVYATELIRGLDGVEETDAYGKPLGMGLPF
jgi:hypothetical protein